MKCPNCGDEIVSKRPCEKAKKKYCSPKCQASFYRKHTDEGWAKVKVSRLRQSALKRDIVFDITSDDLLPRPSVCKYLGVRLSYDNDGLQPDSASVNRIDSSLGYVRGNVEIISNKANSMLLNASREELIYFAKRLLEFYDK